MAHHPPTSTADGRRAFYDVRRLAPHFGVEALGIDLGDADLTDEALVSQLKRDLVDHRAILFRRQSLSGQRQVDISNALGAVESTFYRHPRSPHPDVFRVSNDEAEGCTRVGRSGWHVDGTFQMMPFKYQTMYFPSVAEGGDTHFMPLKELHDSFSAEERAYYDGLWMVTGRRESPVHPLVYAHPFRGGEETMIFHCGRPFVTGWYRDAAKGDSGDGAVIVNGVDTSKMIHPSVVQDRLTEKIESKLDELGLRMKWERGDFLIVDNLGLAHLASAGTQADCDRVGLRILHRTTIVGGAETIPSRADGRKSFTV